MNKFITHFGTAIVSVVLAWLLGYIKPPDSVEIIDFSAGGSELIDSQEEFANRLKLLVDNTRVEKLSIYNVHFINKTSRNFSKARIEFKISPKAGSDFIASSIKGPTNYSDSAIKKISESKNSIVYELDFIDTAGDSERNYFTANFLFSGAPPDDIRPVSLTSGMSFRSAKDNHANDIIGGVVIVLFVIAYIALFWWLIKSGKKKDAVRRSKFEESITAFLVARSERATSNSTESTKEILSIYDSIFNPEGWLKKKIKTWLKVS